MTTYQGIAAVTQTLRYLLGAHVSQAVPEAAVTLLRPEHPPAASVNEPRLNIYLVQVLPDPTFRASDLPTRTDNGTLVNAPKAAVNLRYLLSFFGGSENAHLMLGAAELALREHAVFDPQLVRHALANHPKLLASGLETQTPPVRVVPSAVSLEDLARFWSGFLQMPYTISTLYEAMTVILTSTTPVGAQPPPVLNVNRGVAPSLPPRLEPLPTVTFDPHGTKVPVSGHGLTGLHVEVNGHWLPIKDNAFTLPAAAARAGTQIVTLGTATNRSITGSHPQVLSVRPVITRADAQGARIAIDVAPPVHPHQHVTLSLLSPAHSVRLSVEPTTTSPHLAFTAPKSLPNGRYLTLVDVDGVSSLPSTTTHRPTVGLTR